MKYFLDFLTKSGYFYKMQKGGTVDFVTKKMISESMIHLPPISQQKEIVEELNLLLRHSESSRQNIRRKMKDLHELRHSLLQKAFAGELT